MSVPTLLDLAKLDAGEPVKVIRLDAPIDELIRLTHSFPSSTTARGASTKAGGGGVYTISDAISADGPVPETVRLIVRPDGASAIQRDNGDVIDVTNMIRAGFTPERAIAQSLGDDTSGANVSARGAAPPAAAAAADFRPAELHREDAVALEAHVADGHRLAGELLDEDIAPFAKLLKRSSK